MPRKSANSPGWPGLTEQRWTVFQYVAAAGRWVTNKEVAAGTALDQHAARPHTRALAALGVFDVEPLHPGHRFRLSEAPNQEYVAALTRAAEVFGLI